MQKVHSPLRSHRSQAMQPMLSLARTAPTVSLRKVASNSAASIERGSVTG
jgi:hypothetical protein